MGKAAKRKQARKKFKSGRKPTPNPTVLKSKLNSAELKDWLIHEWNCLANFHLFVTPEQQDELAKVMLEQLHQELTNDYNRDPRIEYTLNRHVVFAVGVNVYSWTVWGFAKERQTEVDYFTPDNKEYKI